VQLDTHVPNARAHDIMAIMGLQDVRAGNAVNVYKACGQPTIVQLQCSASTVDHLSGTAIVPSVSTARCHIDDQVQRGRCQEQVCLHC
jgi:hypothetical protein